MKFLKLLGWSSLLLSLFSTTPVNAQGGGETRSLEIKGVAVTGINRVLGEPIFDFGAPHGTVGFFTIAAYNPSGPEPLPLTPDSPPGTILATAVDLGFLDVFGVKPEEVHPNLINVPLRDVAVISDFTGAKGTMRDHRVSSQMEPGRAISFAGPVTLGQWLKGKGTGTISCNPRFLPRVDLSMEGLIPHGLYTAWGGMLTDLGPRPIALGGIPNSFVADEKGRATFSARLNYCPLALRPGELPLSFIDILYHADHTLYGAVGELINAGYPTGTVTQIHLEFPVSVTLVD